MTLLLLPMIELLNQPSHLRTRQLAEKFLPLLERIPDRPHLIDLFLIQRRS